MEVNYRQVKRKTDMTAMRSETKYSLHGTNDLYKWFIARARDDNYIIQDGHNSFYAQKKSRET